MRNEWLLRLREKFDARNIAKSGAFDGVWYLERYPDIRAAGYDPLWHFTRYGHRENRFPNPIFDTAWYKREYGDQLGANDNPLIDYLRSRADGSRRPNYWLDPQWYKSAHLRGRSKIEPMIHFLKEGAETGLDPGPEFQTREFAQRHPCEGVFKNPLANFLHNHLIKSCVAPLTSIFCGGWASGVTPESSELLIFVNGLPQGVVTPWIPRQDVKEVLGFDALGFYFVFPQRLKPGDKIEIKDQSGRLTTDAQLVYDIPSIDDASDYYSARAAVAARFISGTGLEIGAFTQPTDIPQHAKVFYCDRIPIDVLQRLYDDSCGRPLIAPHFVSDAENLGAVRPDSLDFVIACHVIEHLEDPIAFLKRVSVCLRLGGRAMIVAPDKRFTFDSRRPITSFHHLVEDHLDGGQRSRGDHIREYLRLVDGAEQPPPDDRVFEKGDWPIHFHVWDAEAFIAFVEQAIKEYHMPLSTILFKSTHEETVVVLEKRQT